MMKGKITLVLLIVSLVVKAQQDPNYALFGLNGLQYNPGYAGESDRFRAMALHREQWGGMDEVASTSTFSLNTPVNFERIGLGFTGANQWNNDENQTSIHAVASYKINLGRGKLSFGINGGVKKYAVDFSRLNILDEGDVVIGEGQTWSPDLGTGFLFFNKDWYVGASAMHLLRSSISFSNQSQSSQTVHYYFTAGYKFKLTPTWNLVLSNWTRTVLSSDVPWSSDLNVTAKYKDVLWAGASGHTSRDVSMMMGVNFAEMIQSMNADLSLAYSYSYGFSDLAAYHRGTNEIALVYKFKIRPKVEDIENHQDIVSPLFID